MTKILNLKNKISSVLAFCTLCFVVSTANAADVAKGASIAKSVSSTVKVSNIVRPSAVGKGIVASIVSNGRGSSNLELEAKSDKSSNKASISNSSQPTLTLCGGQLIEGLCLGGGFLPGRYVPPTVTTTVP
ncbi:hypothetical protein [Agaribacter marinus]|uniref:Uncharacterized protein n=1 Tax=Agaribacter marinus TaxID=1431249 RepID=A0AA37SWY4_9ALTE|nr:hypothetical protein [Agaribacter marinus]GLR71127.1 hypothetical protein GCM10007852_20350 [Agaribacter marinus]